MEFCAQDAAAVFLKDAVPVGEVEVCGIFCHDLAFSGQIRHRDQHVFHLSAVGTGIHINCTTHCAGDAISKFQAGQAAVQRRLTQSRKLQARASDDCIVDRPRLCTRMADVFQKTDSHFQGRGIHDHAPVARILKQDVAAVAQQVIFHITRFAQCDHTAELFLRLRLDKHIRRAANFKGAVGGKRLVLGKADLLRLQLLFQSFHKTGFLYL